MRSKAFCTRTHRVQRGVFRSFVDLYAAINA
jgi:hypothetical protein